jgi:hypothetical protein
MNPKPTNSKPFTQVPESSHLLLEPSHLLLPLLDQSARLTLSLIESVAIMPLRFSQRRRLERILARLTKVTTQVAKVATS